MNQEHLDRKPSLLTTSAMASDTFNHIYGHASPSDAQIFERMTPKYVTHKNSFEAHLQ